MKTKNRVKTLVLTTLVLSLFTALFNSAVTIKENKYISIKPVLTSNVKNINIKYDLIIAKAILEEEFNKSKIVYNNMTLGELSNKLNKSLKSTLSNKGYTFAKYAVEYGVDPYLVTAIALHETGCNWTCSSAVRNKNNVGGMMGNGGLLSFSSLDEGIRQFILNIKKNYYNYGLTTPEAMNKKYAASTTWAARVNSYIGKIKAA